MKIDIESGQALEYSSEKLKSYLMKIKGKFQNIIYS